MAGTPPQPPLIDSSVVPNADATQYWCYSCNKRVSVETLANLPDVICYDCKNGFVEVIQSVPAPPLAPQSLSPDQGEDPTFGSHFLQVLRLLAQATRDDEAPPPPPRDDRSEDDFLRIELNGWDNDENDANGEEEDEEDDDDEEKNGNENETDLDNQEDNDERAEEQLDDDEEEEEDDDEDEDEEEEEEEDHFDSNLENEDYDDDDDGEDMRRRRRDVLRLQIRDYASQTGTGRSRILDWAEILMGLDDNSYEFRLEVPESDRYIGNPGDYVDAAGYEALLQNLAESDGGRRGPPAAAKSAIEKLPCVEIKSESECLLCAICKDTVNIGEMAKKLPCGHGYHGECIVPWLSSRNSCPVCRFELPTDDQEYEEERKKRAPAPAPSPASVVNGGASSSG